MKPGMIAFWAIVCLALAGVGIILIYSVRKDRLKSNAWAAVGYLLTFSGGFSSVGLFIFYIYKRLSG